MFWRKTFPITLGEVICPMPLISMTKEATGAEFSRQLALCPMFALGHDQSIYIKWIKLKSSRFISVSLDLRGKSLCGETASLSRGRGASLLRTVEVWSTLIPATSAFFKFNPDAPRRRRASRHVFMIHFT